MTIIIDNLILYQYSQL